MPAPVLTPTLTTKPIEVPPTRAPPDARDLGIVLEAVGSPERDVPGYLEVDHRKMTGSFIRVPEFAEVPYPVRMEPNLVIEYYSKN